MTGLDRPGVFQPPPDRPGGTPPGPDEAAREFLRQRGDAPSAGDFTGEVDCVCGFMLARARRKRQRTGR